jgi:hypothetical protein
MRPDYFWSEFTMATGHDLRLQKAPLAPSVETPPSAGPWSGVDRRPRPCTREGEGSRKHVARRASKALAPEVELAASAYPVPPCSTGLRSRKHCQSEEIPDSARVGPPEAP